MNRRNLFLSLLGLAATPAIAKKEVTVTNVVSGSSDDLVKRLPEILRQNNERLKKEIVDGMRRGRYGMRLL